MDDIEYIIGLMKENSDALGFIPKAGISRYIESGRYIIQTNDFGVKTGYILHGKPTTQGWLTIAQAVIDVDFRENGFGVDVVRQLEARVRNISGAGILLRCAENLPSNEFWQHMGYTLYKTSHPENTRKRAINHYTKSISRTMFDEE